MKKNCYFKSKMANSIGIISTYRITKINENIKINQFETCQVMTWHEKDSLYYEMSPYHLKTDGLEKNINGGNIIFENFYQGSKIYNEVFPIEIYPHFSRNGDARFLQWKWGHEKHIDDEGKIIWDLYMRWRNNIFLCKHPIRYPNGRKNSKYCKCAVLISKNITGDIEVSFLNYIQTRIQFYRNEYCRLIRKLPIYMILFNKIMMGININIQEIDVPHPSKKGFHGTLCYQNGIFIPTLDNLEILINDISEPFGHGLCISYALINDIKTYFERQSILNSQYFNSIKNIEINET